MPVPFPLFCVVFAWPGISDGFIGFSLSKRSDGFIGLSFSKRSDGFIGTSPNGVPNVILGLLKGFDRNNEFTDGGKLPDEDAYPILNGSENTEVSVGICDDCDDVPWDITDWLGCHGGIFSIRNDNDTSSFVLNKLTPFISTSIFVSLGFALWIYLYKKS